MPAPAPSAAMRRANCPGSGKGCRPVCAVIGPERSRSRCRYCAAGMCWCANSLSPQPGFPSSKRQSKIAMSSRSSCEASAAVSINVVKGRMPHFTISRTHGPLQMAIDVYWGSGSPFSWRVLLALEHKGLAYNSHLLHLGMQEHKAPHMLAINPRGRVPVLKDGDYVVFESLAVLYYLERKYPA